MKTIRILWIVLTLGLGSCQEEELANAPEDLRKIAWDYLSPEDQQTVVHWEAATVSRAECCPYVLDTSGETRQLTEESIAVTFHTTNHSLLGPIIVYFVPNSQRILGIGLRL